MSSQHDGFDPCTSSTGTYSLPDAFWDEFVRGGGRDRPAVFRGLLGPKMLSEQELLELLHETLNPSPLPLLGASTQRAPRFRSKEGSVRLYADGRGIFGWPDDALQRLPPVRSIDELVSYTTKNLDARTFAILIEDVPSVHRPLWFRCRDFIQGLVERIGAPASHLYAGVVCGTYEQTPFGIHRDPSSSFMFCLAGTKELWVWPPHYFETTDAVRVGEFVMADPRKHEAAATRLCMRPGDVAYWPSSHWHVGVGVGGFHASSTLGMWETRDIPRETAALVYRDLRTRLGERSVARGYFPDGERSLEFEVGDLDGLDPSAIQEAREDLRLRQISSAGFLSKPAMVRQRLVQDSRWVRGRYPIVLRSRGEAAAAYANGYRIPMGHADLVEIVERLNGRRWLRLAELGDRDATLRFLQQLADVGAAVLRRNPPVETVLRHRQHDLTGGGAIPYKLSRQDHGG